MTVLLDALLDARGLRPASATLAATAGVVAGGASLACAAVVVTAVAGPGGLAWAAPVLQVSAAVLLIAGGARLAAGAGRGVLLGGIASQFLTCAMHVWYVLAVVAGNPDEASHLVPLSLGVAGVFAALAAVTLHLTLRPSTAAFLS